MPTITITTNYDGYIAHNSTTGTYGKNVTNPETRCGWYTQIVDKIEHHLHERPLFRFSLADLPAEAIITLVRFYCFVTTVGGGSHLTDIHAYGTVGQENPELDDGVIAWGRTASGTLYVDDSNILRTSGDRWFTLLEQANIDIQNAKIAVNRFSIGMHEEGDNDPIAILRTLESVYYPYPAKLEITYTIPLLIKFHLLMTRLLMRPRAWAKQIRTGEIIRLRRPHPPFVIERAIQPVSSPINGETKITTGRRVCKIKPMYRIRVIRNGKCIYSFKRSRDLIVWRGQSVLANLLSQGAVGTDTNTWKVIASSNIIMPDMGDDSGDPEANEFNPVIGTPVEVTYNFEPTVKPSGGYQTFGQLTIKGTITATENGTIRKIGIIDNMATPNRNIIVEDAVVPADVVANDQIEIWYFMQLG